MQPMRRLIRTATLLLTALALPAAAAPLLWQDNRLTYLAGQGYEVNPEYQQTLTFEHVSGWSHGDLFVFADATRFNGRKDALSGQDSYYGEFSPRLSLGKTLGREMKAGPLRDVLLAATYEFGEGDVETLLAGPGFDLAIPGFDYFQLNVYRRFPENGRDGKTTQITPVWGLTFPVGASHVVFDGFIDWNVNSDGTYHSNLHFNPQLKYDLGPALGLGKKRLYVGLEYSYWKNKYGIKSTPAFKTDQSAASLILKAHF